MQPHQMQPDKMTVILQTVICIFLNGNPAIWIQVALSIITEGLIDNLNFYLVPNRREIIIWIHVGLVCWRLYASLDLSVLIIWGTKG